jgi:hypothetical protein
VSTQLNLPDDRKNNLPENLPVHDLGQWQTGNPAGGNQYILLPEHQTLPLIRIYDNRNIRRFCEHLQVGTGFFCEYRLYFQPAMISVYGTANIPVRLFPDAHHYDNRNIESLHP